MSALTGDADAIGARTGDGLHDADGNVLLFEQRPLLDVQLDEGGIKLFRQGDRLERVFQSRASAESIKRCAFRIAQRGDFFQRDGPRQHARSETTDAEARRFFRGKDDELDRAHRLEACVLQGFDGRKASEHPDHAVELPRIGNRIGVRTGGHRRGIGCRSFPTREHVAHRVDADA